MYCPRCNKLLPDDANVCDNCGAAIAQQTQPTYANAPFEDPRTKPLTVGNYLLMTLLQVIPIVGIVMLFVWAFGDENINRKNYARAALIWMLIGIGLSIVIGIVFAAFAATLLSNIPNWNLY